VALIDIIEGLKHRRSWLDLLKKLGYPLVDGKWLVERLLTRTCPVCEARAPFERISGYGRTFLKCRSCSHIWAHDYSRMRALIGMGMSTCGGEAESGGDTEMFLARFSAERFGSKSILLFGTGPTRAFRVLLEQGYDVYGCDVSADVIKLRQDEFGSERFFHVDQLADQKFDVIIATEVIEHFFEPIPEMKQVIAHLNPGGVFCGSTGFSQDGKVDEGPNRYMRPRGHVIYWSQQSLDTAFERLGLKLMSFTLGSDFASARIFFGTQDAGIAATLSAVGRELDGAPLFRLPEIRD